MATDRRAVLFLHGFTHTGASWRGVEAALPARREVLSPDLRGHGAASDRRPVTLEAVLEDLDRLLVAGCTVCGYSMGGRIALHAALAAGLAPRVARLVLIGASPGLDDPRERAARRAADDGLANELDGMTIEAFAERWARTPVLAGQAPAVREAARVDRLRSTPSGLAAALRGLGTGVLPSLWDRLPELAPPVTLIVGERDAKFRAVAEAMVARLPHAAVEVVPGAGHAVHLEAPGRVAELL